MTKRTEVGLERRSKGRCTERGKRGEKGKRITIFGMNAWPKGMRRMRRICEIKIKSIKTI